ncbi:PEP-CTERM sorting domain-containing protein [Coleofasciculus sp. E2-BRE-01]|uniref:PEP-CTERM sorting domain-containing protein n=1 Tax=Coleofasciculus sp. E2-BRE-01 TaxID=3069524 RepID=UPI0033008335
MSTLTKKVIGFGTATLAASTVGAFMAAAPAQAMKLSGSVSIDGPAEFSLERFPVTDTIDFGNIPRNGFGDDDKELVTAGSGDFLIYVDTHADVANLTLNLVPSSVSGNSGLYTYDPVPNFITFNDGLTFNLDAGQARREFFGPFAGNDFILNFSELKGTFVTAEGEKAKGILTAQSVSGTAQNFSIDLVVDVPEPTTILGLGVVAGSLALSRAGKKNKA